MLACPFSKFDKLLYRSCRYMTFRQNADLRVHFKRCHLQPPFCPECKAVFDHGPDGRKLLESHVQLRSCQASTGEAAGNHDPPGITPEQCDRMGLSKQRESRSVTPEERVQGWYNMWDALFPGRARPASIYHENSELSERVAEAREAFFAGGRVEGRIEELLLVMTMPTTTAAVGFGDAGWMRDLVYRCVAALFDDFESHLAQGPGNRSSSSSSRAGSVRISRSTSEGLTVAPPPPPPPTLDSFLSAHSPVHSAYSGGYLSPSEQVSSGWQWPSPSVQSVSAASVMEHDSLVDHLSLDAAPAPYGPWLSSHQCQQQQQQQQQQQLVEVDPGALMPGSELGYTSNVSAGFDMGYHGYSFANYQPIDDDYE